VVAELKPFVRAEATSWGPCVVPLVDGSLSVAKPFNAGSISSSRSIKTKNDLRLHAPYSKDVYSRQLRRRWQAHCNTIFGNEGIVSVRRILHVRQSVNATYICSNPFILDGRGPTKSHAQVTITAVRTIGELPFSTGTYIQNTRRRRSVSTADLLPPGRRASW
jgi:hypothetical protein